MPYTDSEAYIHSVLSHLEATMNLIKKGHPLCGHDAELWSEAEKLLREMKEGGKDR